jgi:hypothetical protein
VKEFPDCLRLSRNPQVSAISPSKRNLELGNLGRYYFLTDYGPPNSEVNSDDDSDKEIKARRRKYRFDLAWEE